ncbi:MAG: prepilin-type N-terminal cleavage/methylation domain-containing protein [Myxococcota bacterium]|nr:prepilin-type N-terminal cleavage/methylation domain-containing protein [Myxococcota bacterium]
MKRRAELGLTLLEVMAAVALLGILYAYLAKAASQGILTAGDSRWRLEASMLADDELVKLERQMLEGAPLETGSSEEERELFVITREIEPFTIPLPEPPPSEAPPPTGLSLLGGQGSEPGSEGILRRITIRVAWSDGVDEHQIERVTFGYDASAALPLLGADLLAGGEEGS